PAEDGIRYLNVTGVQTCALSIHKKYILLLKCGVISGQNQFLDSLNISQHLNYKILHHLQCRRLTVQLVVVLQQYVSLANQGYSYFSRVREPLSQKQVVKLHHETQRNPHKIVLAFPDMLTLSLDVDFLQSRD